MQPAQLVVPAISVAARVPPPRFPGILDSRLVFVAFLIALALVSGRLLGIRISWFRGLAAAFVGFVAGFVFYYDQYLQTSTTPDLGLEFGLPALLATMLVLTVLEVAYRPGAVATVPTGLAHLPRPFRATRRWIRRTSRYLQVLWIVARNGLNPYLRGTSEPDRLSGQSSRLALRFRRTLEECGGVFVKLGQVLSTRPDLLSPPFIGELAKLQDAAPPVPYAALEPALAADLGGPTDLVFAEFDPNPLAAASIAQVHLARLQSGDRVVVKIARPGITELVERDLEIIQRLARALAGRAPWARRAGVLELAEGFATAIWEETDFRIEAANITAVGAAAHEEIRVPKVYRAQSTGRVLVMEWLDGVKLRDSSKLLDELGVDREDVARRLLRSVLRQIMVEGVFHCDPHPGNILILRDGTPALIDFGSVGRLNPSQQSALRRMLVGIDRRDPVLMRDALSDLGDVRDTHAQDQLERALSQLLATRLGPGMRPGAELFGDVLRLFVEFELTLPPHVAAVFRCLVTLEGSLRTLAPTFQIVDESRSAAGELTRDAFGAANARQAMRDELVEQLPILRRLPRRIDQLAATLDDGRLAIHVSVLETETERQFVAKMVGRSIFAFMGAALGLISVQLLSFSGGPLLGGGVTLFHSIAYVGLLASAVLILRVVVGVARDRAA
jgi:ubiquinone biosynthesis protein